MQIHWVKKLLVFDGWLIFLFLIASVSSSYITSFRQFRGKNIKQEKENKNNLQCHYSEMKGIGVYIFLILYPMHLLYYSYHHIVSLHICFWQGVFCNKILQIYFEILSCTKKMQPLYFYTWLNHHPEELHANGKWETTLANQEYINLFPFKQPFGVNIYLFKIWLAKIAGLQGPLWRTWVFLGQCLRALGHPVPSSRKTNRDNIKGSSQDPPGEGEKRALIRGMSPGHRCCHQLQGDSLPWTGSCQDVAGPGRFGKFFWHSVWGLWS